jgi:hypothetical protein
LLVFSQKIGGGLYLHNWLHTNTCKQSTQTTGVSVSSYNCSCIDDFSMPFAEDAEKVSQPISVIKPEFSSPDKFLIPPSSTIFYSLRAPPSIL